MHAHRDHVVAQREPRQDLHPRLLLSCARLRLGALLLLGVLVLLCAMDRRREKIADQEHDPAPAQHALFLLEHGGEIAATVARPGRDHLAHHAQDMLPALARGEPQAGLLAEQGQAHTILRLQRSEAHQRAELRRRLALGPLPAAEVHRAALVDDQVHHEFALFRIRLDEGLAGARGHVPIDAAHVVARLVGAHLLELESRAAEGAAIAARKRRAHHAVRADLNLTHACHQLGRQERRIGRRGTL